MIFNDEHKRKADFIRNNPFSKLSDLLPNELKNLAIVWCYYSGKIEGNTYTYVETEALLKDDITSEKRYEDAKMLKNLYNTFMSEIYFISKQKNKEDINEKTLLRIHSAISEGLISSEDVGKFRDRAVRITGTNYTPPKNREETQLAINEILFRQEAIEDPFEKAVFLHCNIAKIQPFIDGNKRTSRLIESIVLMNNDIIPVYSAKDSDILNYRRGIISYYETGDYFVYTDYFLGRQIERINEIAPPKYQYGNSSNGFSR